MSFFPKIPFTGKISGLAISGLFVAYPVLVFFGLQYFPLTYLALGLAVLAVARALLWRVSNSILPLLLALVLLLVALHTLLAGSGAALLFYPVLVNALMLCVFGISLWRGMPVIERLARLQEPDLPPQAVAYTRTVTKIWCGFFVINGSIAAYTALYCSYEAWALYNGLIAYGLMAALLAAEWLVRRLVKERYRAT